LVISKSVSLFRMCIGMCRGEGARLNVFRYPYVFNEMYVIDDCKKSKFLLLLNGMGTPNEKFNIHFCYPCILLNSVSSRGTFKHSQFPRETLLLLNNKTH
jgi:hypothetical protein